MDASRLQIVVISLIALILPVSGQNSLFTGRILDAAGAPIEGAVVVVTPSGASLPVGITIGSVALTASDILYAGVSPSYIGLYQINLRVPAGVPSGKQPMVLTVGTNLSPSGGYLTVE